MEVDNLEIRIESEANKALNNLDSVEAKLGNLERTLSSVSGGGLKQFVNGIISLSNAVLTMSGIKTTDFSKTARNINKLASIDNASMNKVSASLRNITTSLGELTGVQSSTNGIASLANAISKLGYKTASNAISNIPKLASSMKDLITTLSTAPAVSSNVVSLTNALANLASQGSKVRSASNGIANGMNNASNQAKKYASSTRLAATSTVSLASQLTKVVAIFYTIKRAASTVWKSINSSMDYVETINLFETALKKVGVGAAKEAGFDIGTKAGEEYAVGFMHSAEGFADDLSNKLGLDPNMTKKYQATFAQITNAMGNTAVTADNVSRSFTMLGNDIASLWNIDTESAMQKLQAGLAGQVKPLRELGIDITNASLQQTAMNYGIDTSISKMSQAAKVQLRYLTLMRQSSVAFGDMAKTIDSPANQLRILKQQWDNLCRSIGNVFLPLLQTVIPFINGLVIALRRVVDSIAAALGYEVPDYSDAKVSTSLPGVTDLTGAEDTEDALENIGGSYDDVGKSADKATKAVEKFKKVSMGFDQFNIIQNNLNDKSNSSGSSGGSSGSSGAGGSSSGGGYSSLDNAIGDATNGYMQKFNEELAKMSDEAKKIADKIQPRIEDFIEKIEALGPAIAGVAAAFVTYKLIDWFSNLGSVMSKLATPQGIAALVVGALVGVGTAIYKCWKKAKENDLAKRFGDITLSAEELKKVAKELVDNGNLEKLATTLSSWNDLDNIATNIEDAATKLNKLNTKVSLGLELKADDETQYKQAINDYIDNCKAYAEQEHVAVAMSIDLLVKDEKTKQGMLETANKFFTSNEAKLNGLGKKLQNAVNEGWEDGLLTFDEAKKIQEIQTQMSNVQAELAASDFSVKMKKIELTYSAVDLTPECAKKLMDETNKAVQEAVDGFNESTARLVVNIEAQRKDEKLKLDVELEAGKISYDEYTKQLDTVMKKYDLQEEAAEIGRLSNIGEITLKATKVDLNTITRAFGNELTSQTSKMKKSVNTEVNKWFEEVGKGGNLEGQWGLLFTQIDGCVKDGYKQLSGTAKSNMEDILKKMEPKKVELEKIAADYQAMGKSVLESVSTGLTDIYEKEAMCGHTDAILKLVGARLSGTEYEEMIKQAKADGVQVPVEISEGIALKKSDVEKSTLDMVKKVDATITSQSESVNKISKVAGKAVGDSYSDGIDSKQKKATASSKDLVGASKSGIESAMQYDKGESKLFKNYGGHAADSFINKLLGGSDKAKSAGNKLGAGAKDGVISSLSISGGHSTVFQTYGKNTVDGYNKGISENKETSGGVIGEWVRSFTDKFKRNLDQHSPSRLFKQYGKFTVEGYNLGIDDGSETTKSSIDKWGDKIKNSAKGFKVDPLQFQSNYSVNTKGIERYSDIISGNVNLGGRIETTTTQIIQGIRDDIYSAFKEALAEIPSGESGVYMDGEEVGRILDKRKLLRNERYETQLV